MKFKKLGKTDIQASVISFGGIPIQRVDKGEAQRILAACGEEGINFIDTARMYGDSEEKIGEFLRQNGRTGWYVATKSMARDYQGMWQEVETSLRKLRVDCIDLYQLHNVATPADVDKCLSEGGALQALQEAVQKGWVRYIGITGHKPEVLTEAVKKWPFATLQVPYNALEKQALPLLEMVVKEYGMGTIAMKPLAGGALNVAAAALEAVLACPWIDIAIPGIESVAQVIENCAVAEGGATLEQREKLATLVASLGNQFCRRCEYCQPCPKGLKIPAMFLFEGYYTRYNLREWARERYQTLPVKASECDQCGICESRCPYDLPIRKMLQQTAATLEK